MSLVAYLREKKLRLTRNRLAIASFFDAATGPVSAGAVIEALHRKQLFVNKTTVYRELETLTSLGLLQEVLLSNQERMYERAALAHHHHVVCTSCRRVEDVDAATIEEALTKLERMIARRGVFARVKHSLEFFGSCATCQPKL